MGIDAYIHQNPGALLAAGWVLSIAIGTLPDPTVNSSQFYIWLHNFLQALVANMSKMKLPNAMPPPSSMLSGVVVIKEKEVVK